MLMLMQFRRRRTRVTFAASDAPMSWVDEFSQPKHRNLALSISAEKTIRHPFMGDRPGQARSGDTSSFRSSLPQKRPSIRAHFRVLAAGRLRQAASRVGERQVRENAPVEPPDGSRAAEQPSQQDEQFRSTLELLPFAVLMTDQLGQIVFANAVTEKLFGYSKEELIGESATALVPALQTSVHAAKPAGVTFPAPAAGGAAGGGRDLVARRKDGTEFPAEITANPVSSRSEPCTLTVVIDRTERYELQRNRQELTHLTRVSTLGALAGSLAHELNQPLTAILSNAQAAQRFMATQPIDLAEVREILKDLVEDNHRASEVIRKIRALVKKGELEAAPLCLASVIGDVGLLVHSDAIVRGIRVTLKISPELPPVHGDRVQVQQVILNLLLNAFDALEARSTHDRVVVVSAALDDAGMIRVAVRDRGPGLAAEKFEKLFTPFFTSKREGLGLGLSISRSIVQMHGGRIWAENNEDQGATFYFTLPTGATPEFARTRQQP
jgi:two-component system sensor kinase FixL